MLTNKHGIAPGAKTPTSEDGLTASNSQPAKISNSYLSNFKALCLSLRMRLDQLEPFAGAVLVLVVVHMLGGVRDEL